MQTIYERRAWGHTKMIRMLRRLTLHLISLDSKFAQVMNLIMQQEVVESCEESVTTLCWTRAVIYNQGLLIWIGGMGATAHNTSPVLGNA
jgi:hypothetical protein